ncbi:hypothetical protein [Xenorhabdus bovienii]|uniref:hypothetical protein n=1 Tax=Xenorhabdus bovienii TaxID=40576 RepID=UPI0023B26DDE|nr:hypothetical protein [Xenorhabdus bovienii]MDE9542462.1 hypothetical protein [Xenorhabdus bovienii]
MNDEPPAVSACYLEKQAETAGVFFHLEKINCLLTLVGILYPSGQPHLPKVASFITMAPLALIMVGTRMSQPKFTQAEWLELFEQQKKSELTIR